MENGIPLFLQRMENEFEEIDKRLLKFDEPNLKRGMVSNKILRAFIKSFNNYEILKKEKINKLKNEINITESKISDLEQDKKSCSKDQRKCLQQKQDLQMICTQLEEEELNLVASKKKLEEEVKSAQEDMKNTFKAHEQAIKYFRTRLQSWIEIDDLEGPSITMYLLDTEKTDSYFVKLQCNESKWSLLQMKPELSNQSGLGKQLQETGDIQGFLSSVRNQFKKLKMKPD